MFVISNSTHYWNHIADTSVRALQHLKPVLGEAPGHVNAFLIEKYAYKNANIVMPLVHTSSPRITPEHVKYLRHDTITLVKRQLWSVLGSIFRAENALKQMRRCNH